MQRAYRTDINCPHCGGNWLPKAGLSRGKQTYRCHTCLYRFTPEGNRHYYSEAVKRQALRMYGEGMSVSAIGRVMDVKLGTVYSWIKKKLVRRVRYWIWGGSEESSARRAWMG